jgi:hypothetical protein
VVASALDRDDGVTPAGKAKIPRSRLETGDHFVFNNKYQHTNHKKK